MGTSCSSSSSSSAPVETSSAPVETSSALLHLLGPTLVSSSGSVPTSEALSGKAIALYFSAHWCPPCRGFTPELSKAYQRHLKAKGLEIIFVSSDRDEAAFSSYFKEMPWLALPFSDRDRKAALGKTYGVSGIPCLVVIDEKGSVITKDGRGKVMSDPTGKWVPPAPMASPAAPVAKPSIAPKPVGVDAEGGTGLAALLGRSPLLGVDGRTETTLAAAVKDAPLVALYFSAHWCGPCRAFTPKLVTFHQMLEEDGTHLPIIFGSSDRDEAAFQDYFKDMPWIAFPHADPRIEKLKAKFDVSGIPWLVVLDAQGNLVVNEADTDVPKGPQAYKEWLAKAKQAAGNPVAGAPAA